MNRKLTKDVLAETARSPFEGRCDYCGRFCYGRVCVAHSDLPALEQQRYQGETKSHDPAARSLVSQAAGSQRKEILP